MFQLTRREQIAVIVALALAMGGWIVQRWRHGDRWGIGADPGRATVTDE